MVVIETVEGEKFNLKDIEEIWLVEIDNNDYNKNVDVKRYDSGIYTDEDFMNLLEEVSKDMICMPHRCRRLLVELHDGYYNRKQTADRLCILKDKALNRRRCFRAC